MHETGCTILDDLGFLLAGAQCLRPFLVELRSRLLRNGNNNFLVGNIFEYLVLWGIGGDFTFCSISFADVGDGIGTHGLWS